MKVHEAVSILDSVELHQIHRDDGIREVISYLNFALKIVYSRADILVEMFPIQIESNKVLYDLPTTMVRILHIRDVDHPNVPVPLNDYSESVKKSVFTRGAYLLEVPHTCGYKQLELFISSTPPFITEDNYETIDFDIPEAFIEPIVNYAGYRAYKSHNVDDRSATASLWRIFVMSLQDAVNTGILHQRISTNDLLSNRGFA